ncbi:MAG: type II toxin-antitoxin system CcdA family antitoxin [Spirochaetales bacterium]|nr:type II toxin-antitoxin system CcdA family antitoxin [Spirochaetales bacterium]
MKTRTNVSIDRELLETAKRYNLVFSSLLEKAIKSEIKKIEKDLWLKENRDRIRNYNDRVNDAGVFSDDLRSF